MMVKRLHLEVKGVSLIPHPPTLLSLSILFQRHLLNFIRLTVIQVYDVPLIMLNLKFQIRIEHF